MATGAVTAAVGVWLLTQPIRPGGTTLTVQALTAIGVALCIPWPHALRAHAAVATAATAATVVAAVAMAAVVFWVGSNTKTETWFGAQTAHGARSVDQVALTFDDGPDVPYTLDVRDILDRYGVKAAFFTVGKALDARPDVSRALLADGQLLGNHSYHHDSWRWLDPRYPELARTQRAFARNLGVCPAFYRPPHGQHTPLLSRVVRSHGMRTIMWDVSGDDWAAHDGTAVARRVLARVRPGSIIDLHDGLDGHVSADRSVLLTALPQILDGLRQRGLQPVRLDQLLHRPGYLPHCDGAPAASTPAAQTAG